MELTVVPIVKPDAANFIFGQSHFIKTVEDLLRCARCRRSAASIALQPTRHR